MAKREGNWWSGYRNKSDYNPTGYDVSVGPWSQLGPGALGQSLEGTMWDRIKGTSPSVAELQMQDALGRQTASAYSTAASMPNISPGMALRLAGRQAGEAAGRTQMQTGMLRAREQAGAEQRMGGWLTSQSQMKLQRELEEERMRAQQSTMLNRLKMQQDIANAGQLQSEGWGSKLLGIGGALGSAAIMSGLFGGKGDPNAAGTPGARPGQDVFVPKGRGRFPEDDPPLFPSGGGFDANQQSAGFFPTVDYPQPITPWQPQAYT